jgi:hypothetical protein
MRSALPLRPAYKVRSQWGMHSLTLVSIRANPRGWNFRERQVPEPDASAILSLRSGAGESERDRTLLVDLALAKPALRGAPHRARRRQPSSRATGRRSTNSARRPKPAIISRPSGSTPTQANRRAKRSISTADQTTPSPRIAVITRFTSLSASTRKTACIVFYRSLQDRALRSG